MGAVVVQIHAHKDYVDAHMLAKCFMEAFHEIKKSENVNNGSSSKINCERLC